MLSRFIRAARSQAMASVPASSAIGIPARIMIGMETITTGSTIDHAGRQMREAIADLRSRSTTEHHATAGFVPERACFHRTILSDRYGSFGSCTSANSTGEKLTTINAQCDSTIIVASALRCGQWRNPWFPNSSPRHF